MQYCERYLQLKRLLPSRKSPLNLLRETYLRQGKSLIEIKVIISFLNYINRKKIWVLSLNMNQASLMMETLRLRILSQMILFLIMSIQENYFTSIRKSIKILIRRNLNLFLEDQELSPI